MNLSVFIILSLIIALSFRPKGEIPWEKHPALRRFLSRSSFEMTNNTPIKTTHP